MADNLDTNQASGRSFEPLGESDPFATTQSVNLVNSSGPVIMVGSKKGAFFYTCDADRNRWSLQGPLFLGQIVHHMLADPRGGQTVLAAVRTGHLGPTIFRSTDFGQSWAEAVKPPAFPKAASGERVRVVDQVFYLSPGHASEPSVWYAGTSPEGLFRSEDDGNSWQPVTGWNDHPKWAEWVSADEPSTPDGSPLHSILISPDDPERMYVASSSGGVFESTDKGADWAPINKGTIADFLPDPNPEFGQDPHCVQIHPLDGNLLYQQNHCGIYRMDRTEGTWVRIGDNMPADVGDIGFPISLHPRDPKTAWVFPMDGTDVWPRTSPAAAPAVYRTQDSGLSWQRQCDGLPQQHAWYTVYRQAMSIDQEKTIGVYFGTTNGELWASKDEGDSWQCVAAHLPHIYSVEMAKLS